MEGVVEVSKGRRLTEQEALLVHDQEHWLVATYDLSHLRFYISKHNFEDCLRLNSKIISDAKRVFIPD